MESQFHNDSSVKTSSRGFFRLAIPVWIIILVLIIGGVGVVAFNTYHLSANGYKISIPNSGMETTRLHYGAEPKLANSNFFQSVKAQFVANKISFIEADLSEMKLFVYRDGKVVKEVAILTKGREGSWWETPAGLYKIESKKENHFSSFGKVYQPWSMAFQGNFFIHGWPYYPDGTPVASTYSGGCIRLADKDAKEIYDLVKIGTPVLVYEKDFGTDDFVYKIPEPQVTADQYLVADLKNNYVFMQKDIDDQVSIASLTKIVTALVAAEYSNLDKEIIITENMLASTSRPRLVVGQQVTLFNLLYPLLLESSNEAAEAIARTSGRDRFIRLMNDKAAALGMKSTTFVDPSGSGERNVSTAGELFNLAKYVHNNRSFIFKVTTGNLNYTAYGSPVFQSLANFNLVSGAPGTFVGGKVGKTTAAKETYLGVFELDLLGEKRPIAVIILGSDNSTADALAMTAYAQAMYGR